MPRCDLSARAPIVPNRVRTTQGGFAFLPNRFLHDDTIVTPTYGQTCRQTKDQ